MSTRLISKVNQWLKYIQFSLLPGTCILCHKASNRNYDLCMPCADLLPRISDPCESCGLPLPNTAYDGHLCGTCIVKPPPYKHIVSAFDYAEPVDQLIGAFKYHGKLAYGRALTEQLLLTIEDFYANRQRPEILIPMPLHNKRLRQRGFNQAIEIGAYLSPRLKIPLTRQLCIRHRNTPRQEGLNVKARKQNLKQAFSFNKNQTYSVGAAAIIDDVVTTTASTHELTLLLRRNKIKEIHIWSLARACRKFKY